MAPWPSEKLSFECQKIAKNLTFFFLNWHFFYIDILIFWHSNGNFPEGQLWCHTKLLLKNFDMSHWKAFSSWELEKLMIFIKICLFSDNNFIIRAYYVFCSPFYFISFNVTMSKWSKIFLSCLKNLFFLCTRWHIIKHLTLRKMAMAIFF